LETAGGTPHNPLHEAGGTPDIGSFAEDYFTIVDRRLDLLDRRQDLLEQAWRLTISQPVAAEHAAPTWSAIFRAVRKKLGF
jgi:hypothetical protein